MSSSNGQKSPSKEAKGSSFKAFITKLRKRRIIETLAAFVAGGWLLLEFVHWLLVDHYHFPEKTIDITFVTILGALICNLLWRWFSGREAPRKFKLELVLIPFVVLITIVLDINLLLHLKYSEPETMPASKWENSIAVLPFADLSPQKDQDWFCDGMTEEIITRLNKIADLKVAARTSAFYFKDKKQDIREIGRKLGVATVLEGSIQKVETRFRARVQLINIADGFHLWSEEYDREPKDIFAVQDDIAQKIVNVLKIRLFGEERKQLVRHYSENRDVYNLYLKGRYYWNKRGKADLLRSIEYFQETVNKDPTFAPGYSGMGLAYGALGANKLLPSKETFPKAKDAALKALEIDPGLDEAHIALAGELMWYERDFSKSGREFKQAIELNPSNADAHHWNAWLLLCSDQTEEALTEILLARDMDPLAPRINADVGFTLFFKRDYPQAVDELKKSIEMFPEHLGTYYRIAKVYLQMGKYKDAIESILPFANTPLFVVTLAYAYALSGEKNKAQQILNDVLNNLDHDYYSPLSIAEVYVALGDKKQAFYWLEKAVAELDCGITLLKVLPEFDPLRSELRFADSLRRIGLEK